MPTADDPSSPAPPRILIAEKEATRAETLRLILGQIGHYEVTSYGSIAEVIQAVKKTEFDLILTNTTVERLNDGLKLAQVLLLRRLSSKPPTIVFISPQRDLDLVRQARQTGAVDYIVYPYDPVDLLKRIGQILNARNRMSPAEIKEEVVKNLKEILQLPTISPVHNRLNELMADPEVEIEQVASVIEMDPSISAKLLQLSNAAGAGQQRRIASVKDAVSIVGLDEIASLVGTLMTFEAIGRIEESKNFDRMGFWRHSMGTGAVARVLARKLGMDEGQAFSAGILHDIGKVVMDGFFPEFFARALEQAAARDITLYEAEQQVLPLNHEVVGRYLARQWELPEPLVEVIGCHHNLKPQDAEHLPLVQLVHAADGLCRLLKVGAPGDSQTRVLKGEVLEALKLKQTVLKRLMPQMQEEVEEALALLRVA